MDSSVVSKRFLKGVRWLENELNFEKGGLSDDQLRMLKFRCYNVEAAYVLKKVSSTVVDQFMSIPEEVFWEEATDWIQEDYHLLWFLKKIGLGDNQYFFQELENLIKDQTIEGFIHSNEWTHSGPLRVLVATKQESKALSNAVRYWLKNWKEISDPGGIAVGILALIELDYEEYSSAIREEIDYMKSLQHEDGSWGPILKPPLSVPAKIRDTSFAIWSISQVDGVTDLVAQKGLKWLIENQKEDGSWENKPFYTALALMALLAMGEGPKMPLQQVEYKLMKMEQSIKRQRPVFVHTSPLYQDSLHVKEIYNKIHDMLHKAQEEIRIASPFIDTLYEEIINLKQENKNLTVKIITRPKKEAEGMRERISRNVIDLLHIATKGNVVQSSLVHSRIVIIDDKEVLVSTADFTRDQLFDEYNAGIWTTDKETVKKATEFFENLFQLEKQRIQ